MNKKIWKAKTGVYLNTTEHAALERFAYMRGLSRGALLAELLNTPEPHRISAPRTGAPRSRRVPVSLTFDAYASLQKLARRLKTTNSDALARLFCDFMNKMENLECCSTN